MKYINVFANGLVRIEILAGCGCVGVWGFLGVKLAWLGEEGEK